MNPLVLCLILVLLSVVDSRAVNYDTEIQYLTEMLNEKVKVSGSLRAGVMFEPENKKVNPSELYLFRSNSQNTKGKKACIEIQSIDGIYYSRGYVDNVDNDGIYKIRLNSKHEKKLSEYSSDQLVALVSIEIDCSNPSKKTKYIPASWEDKVTKRLSIFINSGVQKTFYSVGKNSQPYVCESLLKEKTLSYDVKCSIDANENLENLKIIREDFGSHFTPISFCIFK